MSKKPSAPGEVPQPSGVSLRKGTTPPVIFRTTFSIPKMDCPAEETLVRLALNPQPGVRHVTANLSAQEVEVFHEEHPEQIAALLAPLNLGATILRSSATEDPGEFNSQGAGAAAETRTLRIVLAINAGMFAAEMIAAFLAASSALLADSLDMFADAAVYAIALFGVGRPRAVQLKAARTAGYLQLLLALGAFTEVGRRFISGSQPEAIPMAGVAATALAANVICMWLLAVHRESGAHMKASWIFTTTDVIANLAVILAAALVHVSASPVPDLVVGAGIAVIVLAGAIRILRLQTGTIKQAR